MTGRKDRRGAREKRRQVARDCRVGFIRQPELAQAGAAIAAAAVFIRPRQRQEFVQGRLHVLARQIDGHRLADERPAGAEDGDRHTVGRVLAEHPFLGRAAQPPERRPLRDRQPHGGADFGDPCARRSWRARDRGCPRRGAGDRRSRRVRTTGAPASIRTRIRLKSVVPPPTSQTSAISSSSSAIAFRCSAIQA